MWYNGHCAHCHDGLSFGQASIYSVTGIKRLPKALCTNETYKATISF